MADVAGPMNPAGEASERALKGVFASLEHGESFVLEAGAGAGKTYSLYINTLMIQRVLREPGWADRLTAEDRRALTPLLWGHVNQDEHALDRAAPASPLARAVDPGRGAPRWKNYFCLASDIATPRLRR